MTNSVRVVLTSPVEYAGKDGKLHNGSFVELQAPTSAAFRVAVRIKQQMLRAIMSEQRKAASDPLRAPAAPETEAPDAAVAESPTGADMLAMLAQSDADLAEIGDLVRELIVSHGIALLDGEVKMTALLVDRLSLRDFEAIVGEYLATFPLA